MDDTNKISEVLKNNKLFGGFSSEILDAVIPCLTTSNYKSGQLIFLKGDPSDSLYIIQSGAVDIAVYSGDGRVILLGTLSEGDVFGEIGLLDNKARTANVTARSDVSMYRLSDKDFKAISKEFGEKELKSITSYVCNLFRRVTNNLEDTVFMDASIRLANKIFDLYEESGEERTNDFVVNLSQKDLGRMASLSREATNKALSKLEAQGLIKRKYKGIIVPDIKKFHEVVGD